MTALDARTDRVETVGAAAKPTLFEGAETE
jgi:hypothetical protein